MPSLILCTVCKKEISEKATACPHCGQPATLQLATAPKKVTFWLVIGIIFLPYIFAWYTLNKGFSKKSKIISFAWLGYIVIALTIGINSKSIKSVPTSQPTAVQAPKVMTEAEIQHAKIVLKFGPAPSKNGFDGSYYIVKEYLEQIANDPDSISITGCSSLSYNLKKGWIVGCNFRGKNAFGALVKNSNWFVIVNEKVVKVLPASAYKN